MLLAERLDFYVNARGKIQSHEGVHGLRRWLEDVQKSLMRSHLELLA
jgi:hypothetical protein